LVGNWTTNGIVAPDMYRAGRVPRDRNNVRVALAVEIDDWGAEIALEASGDHLLDKSAAAKMFQIEIRRSPRCSAMTRSMSPSPTEAASAR
jgi:hypothetical protein